MNVVRTGESWKIYGEAIETFKKIPVGTYEVNFNKMTGFYLTNKPNPTIAEKVYGNTEDKVRKVMYAYQDMERNFGVLLSGSKGIGKSLFVKYLAIEALKTDYPVIMVTAAIPGIAGFLSDIDQDVMIVFDEFEKVFADQEDWHPQDDLLTLFDGMDGGHKLFVVTCNELNKVNKFMLNRPGRFHYHFTMQPPTEEEVSQYMYDKLLPQYRDSIHDVVNLSKITELPYDFLRAIAFELNRGYTLHETMQDLNITRTDDIKFNCDIYCANGDIYHAYYVKIDLTEHRSTPLYGSRYNEKLKKEESICLFWSPHLAHQVGDEYVVNEQLSLRGMDEYDFDTGDAEDDRKKAEEWNEAHRVLRVVLTRCATHGEGLRYAV